MKHLISRLFVLTSEKTSPPSSFKVIWSHNYEKICFVMNDIQMSYENRISSLVEDERNKASRQYKRVRNETSFARDSLTSWRWWSMGISMKCKKLASHFFLHLLSGLSLLNENKAKQVKQCWPIKIVSIIIYAVQII